MAGGTLDVDLKTWQSLLATGTTTGRDDAELLRRFAADRDEFAFEAILRRHGPAVLRVCRGLLGNPHDADDAFQATFVVLARKAGSIRRPESLASWLYGVAVRASRQVKIDRARRKDSTPLESDPIGDLGTSEQALALRETVDAIHQEVGRLPGRYREAILLCDLGGQTHAEAARHLKCPEGTVSVRLARARERLRGSLVRRGLAPAVALAVALNPETVPAALIDMARSATRPGAASAATSLAQKVLKTMLLTRLKAAAAVILFACGLTAGAGLIARASWPGDDAKLVADAPKPLPAPAKTPTLAEQFQALTKEYEESQRRMNEVFKTAKNHDEVQAKFRELRLQLAEAIQKAKTFDERRAATLQFGGIQEAYGNLMVELAEMGPDDRVAIDAFWWCLAIDRYGDPAAKAATLMLEHQGKGEQMRRVCTTIANYTGPLTENIARFLIRENPDREVQARARVALAKWLQQEADQENGPAKLGHADEAESLYREVIRKFADLKETKIGPSPAATALTSLDELYNVAVGKVAPEIEGVDADGKPMKLSDYRGKVVVLSFGGDWCGFCKAEYPQDRALVERMKGQPFAFLGVNSDEDPKTLRDAIDSKTITWPCWRDGSTDGPIHRKWNIRTWPTIILLDHKGVIRHKGDIYRNEDVQRKAIDALMAEMKADTAK